MKQPAAQLAHALWLVLLNNVNCIPVSVLHLPDMIVGCGYDGVVVAAGGPGMALSIAGLCHSARDRYGDLLLLASKIDREHDTIRPVLRPILIPIFVKIPFNPMETVIPP
jgi:hypothetical protein